MSRDFVYHFNKAYMGNARSYLGAFRWARRTSSKTYDAVMDRGKQLYGETMTLSRPTSEEDTLCQWLIWPTGSDTIEEQIWEIFLVGRYAPYNKRDTFKIEDVVVKHPVLLAILKNNGYYFDNLDPGAMYVLYSHWQHVRAFDLTFLLLAL